HREKLGLGRSRAVSATNASRGALRVTALWHFMGKKSVPGTARLQPLPPEVAELHRTPQALGPLLAGALEDVKGLLSRQLLRNFLQQRLLEENQEERDLKDQAGLLSPSRLLVQPQPRHAM
uniref:Uncharacterized protein n=1 Tax=Varanus komodoensis TaxID=61221 RepID=A0A8D2J6D2_VARKO